MKKEKKQRVLAWPPRGFQWVEDMSDLEKLSEIHAKLESIASVFSHYREPDPDRPAMASDIYGYWFILTDIREELGKILRVDHWTGEIGKEDDEGEKEKE